MQMACKIIDLLGRLQRTRRWVGIWSQHATSR